MAFQVLHKSSSQDLVLGIFPQNLFIGSLRKGGLKNLVGEDELGT